MKPPMKLLTPLLAIVFTLALGVGPAAARESIEGIWSFNGGQVAVQTTRGGGLVGTVVEPTKFTDCTHPVGEQVWTAMQRQPDGSYWGRHLWYFNTPDCLANPTLGLTAWRVLEKPGGSKFLRVCFSEPGSLSQPTIAADGTAAAATFGCSDSALVAPLPPAPTNAEAARFFDFPRTGNCVGRHRLRIKLTSPASDPFAEVNVSLRSGTVNRRAKLRWLDSGVIATLRLRGLTAPTFKVTVATETVLGHKLAASGPTAAARWKRRHAPAKGYPGRGMPAGQNTTTERSTSPRCIFSNASSMSSMPMRLADERVERQPALQEQVDEHREVPRGQAVAVPGRLQRAAAAEHVDERQLESSSPGSARRRARRCRRGRGRRTPACRSRDGRPPR